MARAPGRVNLLGGHTDYNEGFVLPAATPQATYVAAAPRNDGLVRIWSEAFEARDEFQLSDLRAPSTQSDWPGYIRGVAWALAQTFADLRGVDAAIVGDLPIGGGVASSASVEVAFALAMLAANERSLDEVELALLCQRAENEFVGMRCGILDQFTSAVSREGSALLLDCRSLEVKSIPLRGANASFVVCDTGKPRELRRSEYNARRAQCETAARELGVPALRDATLAGLEAKRGELDDRVFARARHIISENQRVLQGAAALERGDLPVLGKLLREAHESLRVDYEVSCRELDEMVRIASETEGCFGARLIGAGFGGCALAVVETSHAQDFCGTVEARYTEQVGRECRTLVTWPSHGAAVVVRNAD